MSSTAHLYEVAHFEGARVFFDNDHAQHVQETHDALLRGCACVREALGPGLELPFANVFLLPNRAEFDRFVAHLTPTPTSPGRVGQPQGLDLHLLSPSAYAVDAAPALLGPDGRYDAPMYERLISHETVHMIEEYCSPPSAMENRPVWWSEGLAVLISEQHRFDVDVHAHMKSDLRAAALPRLDELVGAAAYTWAWAAVACLLQARGAEAIVELIGATDGSDVLGLLDIARKPFEDEWRAYAVAEARTILGATGTD